MLLDDVCPILHAAKFFGCAPHVITDSDVLITKRGIVYSVVWSIAFLMTCVAGVYLLFTDNELEPKLKILTISRTILSYVCLFTDEILSLLWNWKLRSALSQMRVFDRTTRFYERCNSRRTRFGSYGFVGGILLYWSVVGYLTYACEGNFLIFNAMTYAIVNITMMLQLVKFAALMYLLRQRFHWLCEELLLQEEGSIVKISQGGKRLKLQEIWWLHSRLADACETVNSVYAVQLLLWIGCMSFNTLSRLYTINNDEDLPTLLKSREFMLVIACATNVLVIAVICHSTALQANKVGRLVFSPLSPIAERCIVRQDYIQVAAYFQLREVQFSAGSGLIRIDLPLLLSLASGITTYLVILHAGYTS